METDNQRESETLIGTVKQVLMQVVIQLLVVGILYLIALVAHLLL